MVVPPPRLRFGWRADPKNGRGPRKRKTLDPNQHPHLRPIPALATSHSRPPNVRGILARPFQGASISVTPLSNNGQYEQVEHRAPSPSHRVLEGMSIRATVRTTGVAKNTIVKLLADLGDACADYMDAAFTNLDIKRVEADEIWSFCYAKQKNVPEDFRAPSATATCGRGSRSTPTRSWSRRGWSVSAPREDCYTFLRDLRSRLKVGQPHPTHHRRPRHLPAGRGRALAQRDRLRRHHQGVRQRRSRGSPPLLARDVHEHPEARHRREPRSHEGSATATSSARTSRCGWGCAASPG